LAAFHGGGNAHENFAANGAKDKKFHDEMPDFQQVLIFWIQTRTEMVATQRTTRFSPRPRQRRKFAD
jgi:hypothetical protein